MLKRFTLDFWIDDGWYVGKLREVPGVFSQGKTLKKLKRNIKDAYDLMMRETTPLPVKKFSTNRAEVK